MNILKLIGLDQYKYLVYAGAVVLSIAFIGAAYYIWKHNVQHAATLEYEKKQLEESLKTNEKYIQEQQELMEQQKIAAEELARKAVSNRARSVQVKRFIDNSPDSPAPDVIRQTIENLRDGK
jgi:hypothetical protein